MFKGKQRERNLQKSAYFNENYFALPQLFSFAQQIHDIHNMKPENILEIGIGNGFTSTYMKRAGFNVTTVDINPELQPDICCPIDELPSYIKESRFDLVVCCEVLEHMPFEEFEKNIAIINSIGNRLYMTLPNHKKVFGFAGIIRIPKFPEVFIKKQFEMKNENPLSVEHFWEVDSSSKSSKSEIISILKRSYNSIKHDKYGLNPYHIAFQCS